MSEATQNSRLQELLRQPLTVAVVTAFVTLSLTTLTNYEAKKWDTDAQIKLRNFSDERQVYAQIAGQKSVLLQLHSYLAFNSDAFAFYQASSAGMNAVALAENKNPLSKVLSEIGSKTLDDGFQKERLIEHYHDQLITVTQQLFSALAEARILFSPDPKFDELLQQVEEIPDYDYHPPSNIEMLQQTNINVFLEARRKRADADLRSLYGKPLDELLAYLKQKIDTQP